MLCKRTSEHIRLPLYFRDMRSCPRYSSQCCFRVWRHTPGARRATSCRVAGQLPARRIPVDRQAGRLQALDRVHALFRHAVSGADPVRSAACRHVPRGMSGKKLRRAATPRSVWASTTRPAAKFISEKCGMTTIQVTNNQSPQTPLFSPLPKQYSAVFHDAQQHAARLSCNRMRCCRLDSAQCIVLLRGQYPMLLYKITPEEFAAFDQLRPVSITDYPAKPSEDDAEDTPPEPEPPQPPEPPSEQPSGPPEAEPPNQLGKLVLTAALSTDLPGRGRV